MRREGGGRAALFDLDGVLVDSEPYHRLAWQRLCREEGVTLSLEQVTERILGRPVRESLPTLLGRPVDPAEAERLIRRRAALYESASGGTVREVPGAVAFVRSLTGLGVPRGLATSAVSERVDPVLEALGLAEELRVRVTGDDVQRGKPDPEVYLAAAARLGMAADACVVFEDAPVGVVAARRAGMSVVGVTTTCSAQVLQAAGARLLVPDFARLAWRDLTSLG